MSEGDNGCRPFSGMKNVNANPSDPCIIVQLASGNIIGSDERTRPHTRAPTGWVDSCCPAPMIICFAGRENVASQNHFDRRSGQCRRRTSPRSVTNSTVSGFSLQTDRDLLAATS